MSEKHGPETRPFIPHSRPSLGSEEERAVLQTIKSGRVGKGEQTSTFVASVSELTGMTGGVTTNSGTTALFLAMRAIGLSSDTEVLIPSYVCAAVYQAVLSTGAKPVLVDCAANSYNMDPVDAFTKLGTRAAAIVIPHLFGEVADVEPFRKLDIPIIEDLAQAIGAHDSRQLPVGGAGDYSICSFYATKVMTTGQGGMALARESEAIGRLERLTTYDGLAEMHEGYNASMSEMQAAMGKEQLKKLPGFIRRRKEIAGEYDSIISERGLSRTHKEGFPFRYVLNVKDPDRFIESMAENNVRCEKPVYMPLHRYVGLPDELFPHATYAMNHAVSIPLFPSLSKEEIFQVKNALARALSRKSQVLPDLATEEPKSQRRSVDRE